MAAKKMKKAIEAILKAHGALGEFSENEDFHRRIENPPFMPLAIERHGREVTVTHYFEQAGDLVPDSDMAFEIGADGEWYPVAIQFATGDSRIAVEYRDGRRFVNPRAQKDQESFTRMWARNLRAQGFAESAKAN